MKKKFFPYIIPFVSVAFVAVLAHGVTPHPNMLQTASVGEVVDSTPHVYLENVSASNDADVFFPVETEMGTISTVETESETVVPESEVFVDDEQERLLLAGYIACPFSEKENRTIVDFTEKGVVPVSELEVRADKGSADATYTKDALGLGPGTYAIQVASYRLEEELEPFDLYEESWFVKLFSKNGTELLTSTPTRDMQKDETKTIELVEHEIHLKEVAEKAVAHHSAYPNTKPHKISPLCIAFDLLQNKNLSQQEGIPERTSEGEGVLTTKTTVVIPSDTDSTQEAEIKENMFQVLSEEGLVPDEKVRAVRPFDTEQYQVVENERIEEVEVVQKNTTTYEQAQISAVGTTVPEGQKGLALVYMVSLLCTLGMIVFFGTPYTENAREMDI